MVKSTDQLLSYVTQIVSAHVAHNDVPGGRLPDLIRNVYLALADTGATAAPAGVEAWRMARGPRVADMVSGVLELQEAAFEAGGVSSFPLLDEHVPNYPVGGVVRQIERLDLDPASPEFGSIVPVAALPSGIFWPHRYFVTLAT